MQSWLTKSMGSYTFASCTRSLGNLHMDTFCERSHVTGPRRDCSSTGLTALVTDAIPEDKGCLQMIRGRSL